MKKVLFLVFAVLSMLSTNAQVITMTGTSSADSATVTYITGAVTGGYGSLAIQANAIKVANTGTTVAGYMIIQGSNDGVTWTEAKSWKTVKYASATAYNLYDIDTFTLANVTTKQCYLWNLSGYSAHVVPYIYYRVKVVMTTTKVTTSGTAIFRKQP